jgi:hypothetical protein
MERRIRVEESETRQCGFLCEILRENRLSEGSNRRELEKLQEFKIIILINTDMQY